VNDEQKEPKDTFGEHPADGSAGGAERPPAGESAETKAGERASGATGEKLASLKSEETVGEILFAARERLAQTLEFMSQETKIPKQTLQYLETDNYEALPAKVYAKSFLRAYASALGLDIQHILSKYEVQTGQTHRSKGDHWEIETEVVEEKLRSPNVLKRYVIPAAIVIALIFLVIKLAGRKEDKAEPPRQIDLREELLQSKSPVVEEPAARKSEPVETPAEPMELSIVANPTDSCWFDLMTVSIVEQQPETTINRFTLPPGRARAFQATEEFYFLKVGNAGGFVMELNGSKLPTLGRKGKVITNYRITRENLPRGKKD
jgi:cytoskeletal protein RodZ